MNLYNFIFIAHKIKMVVFPPICAFCGDPTEDYNSLCAKCWLSINFINRGVCRTCGNAINVSHMQKYPSNISMEYCHECQRLGALDKHPNFIAAIAYDDFVKPFIIRMKQKNAPELALLFAKFFHAEDFSGADYIVPVPIHPLRLYHRTYNQTALLAYALRHWYGNAVPPIALDLLKKTKYTPKQKGKNAQSRIHNVQNSFIVPSHLRKHVEDKVIVILDDVLASGATLQACQQALQAAGAKEVRGVALAQTMRSFSMNPSAPENYGQIN